MTIHNGIAQLADQHAPKYDSLDSPLIMMVARFEVPKRQDALLAALMELPEVPWRIQFIGDGSLRPDLEKYVTDKGFADRVTFLGNQSKVTELLAQAQLFVLLSDWEGLPIAIIEAMRAAFQSSQRMWGVSELITDNDNGFIIDREDKELLKQRLRQLLTDAALRQKWEMPVNGAFTKFYVLTDVPENIKCL